MTVELVQKKLGKLYRGLFANEHAAKCHMLELGFAIKRCENKGLIHPMDDWETVKETVYNDMDWAKIKTNIERG